MNSTVSDDQARGQQRTAVVSIVAATALVLLKLVTGVITGSIGLISAGIESSGDVVAAVLTLFAIRLARRPPDAGHQYGHGRAENLSALGEAAILAAGAAFIVTEAVGRLKGGSSATDVHWYSLLVIGLAIVVDLSRTSISLATARRYHSAALRSNAFHFGADLIGSVAVLAGLLFVRAGYEQGDTIAALFVSVLITVGAGRLIWENSQTLMDRAPAAAEDTARQAIEALDLPVELQRLRMRESGGRAYADIVVNVPPAAAVGQGHAAADAIEAAVAQALPGSDVVVHVEPGSSDSDLTERVLAAAMTVPRVREAHNVTVYRTASGDEVSMHLKLPERLSLRDAEGVAAAVEEAVKRNLPSIRTVHLHLEPLRRARDTSELRDRQLERQITELVRDTAGAPPAGVRLLAAGGAIVTFVDVDVLSATSLSDAHDLASRIEERLRAETAVSEVIVATRVQT